MKIEMRYCGLAAILAVVLFSISVGYFLNSGQAAYTPANPVIASWDAVTDIPKNLSANGTFWKTEDNTYITGMALSQPNGALALQDDALRWSVSFPDTAPHTLYIRAYDGTTSAIITVSIDGTNQSTIDLYDSGTGKNAIFTASITPTRVGKNVMQFWAATKNPSSTDYFMTITEWWII